MNGVISMVSLNGYTVIKEGISKERTGGRGIFVDCSNFTGTRGRNLVYSHIFSKGYITLLP